MLARRLLVLLTVTVTLAGCGSRTTENPASADETPAPTPSATATATAISTTEVVPYLLRGEDVAPVAREVPATEGVAAAAVRALLAGPTSDERSAGLSTAIPDGTRLLGLTIQDGIATIDLSGEFESGGGSLSMQGRTAQIVHTLTRFPSVQRVAFHLDGRPVSAIGGEGVVVSPPVDRAGFEEMAPQILVESPLPGAGVTSPLQIRGTSNNFEATFIAEVRGPAGERLAKEVITATSGSGTRGTFEATLRFESRPGSKLELYAYEPSAQDGRPIHEVRIPLVAG